MSQFELDCLNAHNEYRARHGCPPLELDRDLCSFATEWAEYIASKNVMQHRNNNRYGENIFMAGGRPVSGRDAVDIWYDEIKNYNYGRGVFAMNTGHFTQVVWRDSKRLGVGFAKRGQATFVVANYDPPGNYAGRYNENVPRRM